MFLVVPSRSPKQLACLMRVSDENDERIVVPGKGEGLIP